MATTSPTPGAPSIPLRNVVAVFFFFFLVLFSAPDLGFVAADDTSLDDDSSPKFPGCSNKFQKVIYSNPTKLVISLLKILFYVSVSFQRQVINSIEMII